MAVNQGDTVRVHYKGTLADGSLFDSSEGRDPLSFTAGAGEVIPGFDEAVMSLEPGESIVVTIAPENAYGPRIEEMQVSFPVADFGEEEPVIGGMVMLVSPEGQEIPGRIVAIEDDAVAIDCNHPLAGEALTFELTLVDVTPA